MIRKKYGYIDYVYGTATVSTDFVSRLMLTTQSLHTDISEGEYFIPYVLVVVSDFKAYYQPGMPGLHPDFCSYNSLL